MALQVGSTWNQDDPTLMEALPSCTHLRISAAKSEGSTRDPGSVNNRASRIRSTAELSLVYMRYGLYEYISHVHRALRIDTRHLWISASFCLCLHSEEITNDVQSMIQVSSNLHATIDALNMDLEVS